MRAGSAVRAGVGARIVCVRACNSVTSGSRLCVDRRSGVSVSCVRERHGAAGTERCEWVLRSQHTPTESRSDRVHARRTRPGDSLVRFGAGGKRDQSERSASTMGRSSWRACGVQGTVRQTCKRASEKAEGESERKANRFVWRVQSEAVGLTLQDRQVQDSVASR